MFPTWSRFTERNIRWIVVLHIDNLFLVKRELTFHELLTWLSSVWSMNQWQFASGHCPLANRANSFVPFYKKCNQCCLNFSLDFPFISCKLKYQKFGLDFCELCTLATIWRFINWPQLCCWMLKDRHYVGWYEFYQAMEMARKGQKTFTGLSTPCKNEQQLSGFYPFVDILEIEQQTCVAQYITLKVSVLYFHRGSIPLVLESSPSNIQIPQYLQQQLHAIDTHHLIT